MPTFRTTSYRYPHEHLVLLATLLLVLTVIVFTATATVCASLIFIPLFIIFTYYITWQHHQALIQAARRVTPDTMPQLADLVQHGASRLQPGAIEVYLAPGDELNAYTFGLSSPRLMVLYSSLLQVMDRDELLFVLGHELGHVALGHTWLNSLVGGMAGIPASWSAGSLLTLAFLWWNRVCEYSADRAGLLACGRPEKAVSALVKLAAGPAAHSLRDLQKAYQKIDSEDDTWLGSLGETLQTHPLLIRRIDELRGYAASSQYQRLLAQVIQNERPV